MGSEYVVGKQSAVASSYGASSSPQSAELAPGKRTLVEDAYAQHGLTGDSYIDHGAVCDSNPGADGCSLGTAVRSRLMNSIHDRVNVGLTMYVNAVTMLQIDKLLEHDEDEAPWYIDLIEGAVFSVFTGGLLGAVSSFKSVKSIKSALDDIADRVPEGTLQAATKGMNEKAIEATVGVGLDKVKELAKPVIAHNATGELADKKSAQLNYLALLKERAPKMYQELREKIPAKMTDAELIAYWESWDEERCTESVYQETIEASLKMYMGSQAKNIGRTGRDGATRELSTITETRVAKLVARDGSYQYIYVTRTFEGRSLMDVRMTNAPAHVHAQALSLSWPAEADDGHIEQAEAARDVDGFAGFIEPAMLPIALARHKEAWFEDPQILDYSYLTKQGSHP